MNKHCSYLAYEKFMILAHYSDADVAKDRTATLEIQSQADHPPHLTSASHNRNKNKSRLGMTASEHRDLPIRLAQTDLQRSTTILTPSDTHQNPHFHTY